MITTADIDYADEFRERNSFSPSVLLLTFPDEHPSDTRRPPSSSSPKLHSRRKEERPVTPYTGRSNPRTARLRDSQLLSYSWLKKVERVDPIVPAPDLAYRYSYLEQPKRKKSAPMNRSFSLTPRPRVTRVEQALSRPPTANPSSPRSSLSTYDRLLQSFREIDRQRYCKQDSFPACIKRPLNDDVVLQRALSAKRRAQVKGIVSSKEDFRHTQTMNAYINPSVDSSLTSRSFTPNRLYV